MPIFEYQCKECGHQFEDLLSVDSVPKCPECGEATKKLISLFSGVVKGSEHKLLDCIVGEDAERRRGFLEKRKEKRKNQQKGE